MAGWLADVDVQAYLRVDAGTAEGDRVAALVPAVQAYVEEQRADLFVTVLNPDGTVASVTFTPPASVVLGARMLVARLYARQSTPQGLASFGEFGPALVARVDPDVTRLLGIGPAARPVAR